MFFRNEILLLQHAFSSSTSTGEKCSAYKGTCLDVGDLHCAHQHSLADSTGINRTPDCDNSTAAFRSLDTRKFQWRPGPTAIAIVSRRETTHSAALVSVVTLLLFSLTLVRSSLIIDATT